jgi:hypothetical protein
MVVSIRLSSTKQKHQTRVVLGRHSLQIFTAYGSPLSPSHHGAITTAGYPLGKKKKEKKKEKEKEKGKYIL